MKHFRNVNGCLTEIQEQVQNKVDFWCQNGSYYMRVAQYSTSFDVLSLHSKFYESVSNEADGCSSARKSRI